MCVCVRCMCVRCMCVRCMCVRCVCSRSEKGRSLGVACRGAGLVEPHGFTHPACKVHLLHLSPLDEGVALEVTEDHS